MALRYESSISGDPERTRGRKYHRSFSNTFDLFYRGVSPGSTPPQPEHVQDLGSCNRQTKVG